MKRMRNQFQDGKTQSHRKLAGKQFLVKVTFAVLSLAMAAQPSLSLGQTTPASAPEGVATAQTSVEYETCVADASARLKTLLKARSYEAPSGLKLSPERAYIGTTAKQSATDQTLVDRFLDGINGEFSLALQKFRQSNGPSSVSAERVSEVVIGSAKARLATTVYRRLPIIDSVASANTKCKSESCLDFALEVRQVMVSDSKSANAVVDVLSASKLATNNDKAPTLSCVLGEKCEKQSDLVRLTNPFPMQQNKKYLVREMTKLPLWYGSIQDTTLYQVDAFDVCGEKALLLSSVLVSGAGNIGADHSFDSSSLFALIAEHGSQTLMVGHYQATQLKKRGPAGFAFIDHTSQVREAMAGFFNRWASGIGTKERVNSTGQVTLVQ